MTVDLRLAPAALGSWLSALLVVRAPPGTALVAAVAAGVVALVVALGPSRRRWDGIERPTWRASVVLALLAAAAVGAAGAAQVGARERGLLPELTAGAAVGTVVGRVSAEPVPVRAAWPGAPPRVRWALDVTRVEAAGRASGAVGRVVVLGGEPAAGVPAYGARVQVTGRMRAAQRGAREVALLVASADPVVLAPPRAWDAAAGRVRAHVRRLAEPLPGDAAALLPGVTVGDTARVPDDLSDAMRASGLTHLVAVSGAHFALVASLVLAGTAALRAPPRVQAAATVVVAAGMLVLVHPEPSVVRAATMGAVAVLGLAAGRPARSPAALGAAVTVLLVADPWLAAELGFALSVAATAGIVLLGVALTRRWAGRLGHGVAAALAVPVAAQLVCAPLVLVASGVLTPWGVLANVAAAPAVAPATLLGLLAAALAPWWPGGAQAAAAAAGAACWWIGAVARHAAQLPGARLAWVPGTVGVTLLAAAGLALARLLLGRRREVSAASGRLDPCPRPPAPAVPPVVVPAVSAARRRPPA